MLKCVNIWNDINRRSSQQITSSQAWICNPKMLGFRLSWLQKESYIVKVKHLYTWTINYCTYRFRASTPCVLGIWRHLPFQSCQRWLLWCIRVCAVCNIVHDLFNENKLFFLRYRFYFSMCVFDIINMDETSCEFSFSLYVSPMRNVFAELKAKRDIFHNIGYRTGKRVSSNRLRGHFWGRHAILRDTFMVSANEALTSVVLHIPHFTRTAW